MKKIKQAIVEALKDEMEYSKDNYSQWILGISIKKSIQVKRVIGSEEYTVRVVVKTNESPYVDGMDIEVLVIDGEVKLAPDYYEQTPEYQGGTLDDAIKWLGELNETIYLQLEDPLIREDDNNDK